MGPFQGVQVTSTTLHLGKMDLEAISIGSIQPEQITGDHALMGVVPAIDQKMIRGAYSEQVTGLRDTLVQGTDKLEVDKSRTTTIGIDHTLTVTGSETTEIYTDRKLHVFAHDIENYAVHREIEEPFLYEKKGFDGAMKGVSLDTVGMDLAVKVSQIETTGIATGGALIELEHKAIHHRLEALRSHVAGFVDGVAGFAVKVETEVNASATMSADHLG